MNNHHTYTILAEEDINKPDVDDRSYRLIKLNQNDLHVLLINDPTTDKAAASLDVYVGSYADKTYGIPGLAHFCEHLLFMGTEKYPEENEYSSYLAQHSGHSNAYTAAEHTNYHFQLSSDHLQGGLDRFAQFFINPLFSASCQDREILAVDSENKKNLQNDLWRFYQLDKTNSNENHPYNGFSTGNFQTLHVDPISKNLDVREILIDFYESNYSSNLMSLVILGKQDLDTLTEWSIEMFSKIPNKNLSRPNYNGELVLPKQYLGTLTKARPVMDTHKIELTFMIPDDLELKWESKPSSYYSHLLGHESEGSVLYYLKQKGWVTDLSAGNMKVCQGSSFFILEFDLTPAGLESWYQIVETVFQYLKYIETNGPQEWIWQELANMSKLNFRFEQKADAAATVSKYSNQLYKFTGDGKIPPNRILNSTIPLKYDPQAIIEYGSFLNPDNFKITITSQTLTGLNKKEKWYGTEYSYEPIPEELMKKIKSVEVIPQLHLPAPNNFIPLNLDILQRKSKDPLKHPYLIEDNNKMQVWYKQDDQFEVPKGTIELILHLPNSNNGVKSSSYSSLLAELFNDELNSVTYYASLVGLKVHVGLWRDGFNVKISGYNDKLPVLLETIIKRLINFKPNKERYESIKFKMYQDLKNFGFNVPYNQIGTHLLLLTNEKTYRYEDRIQILNEIATFEDVYEFATTSLWESGVYTEALIHGNFDITTARDIKDVIDKYTKSIPSINSDIGLIQQTIRLKNYISPPNDNARYELYLQDEDNINSCIEYYVQISPDRDHVKLRVLTDLLATLIREPCFNQLRTKEQLGYVVFSGLRICRNSFGFRVLIQSERSTYYLEYRIHEFLHQFGRYINNDLTDEDFAKFKQALKDIKLTRLKHLNEETSRFWNAITDGYYNFEARIEHVEILQTISKQEFISYYNDYILNNSKQSSKLIVHLKSQKVPEIPVEKQIYSSIVNFSYRHDLNLDLDQLKSIIDVNSVNKIVAEIVPRNKSFPNLHQELTNTINQDLQSLVPSSFPTGKLYTDIKTFRSNYELGVAPKPVQPLSDFYYPDSSHL
jgi:insulysin